MSDRVALVTGSTSGIGAAIARRPAHDGYTVALHSRRSADVGRAMAQELGKASYHQADLGDETAARGLVASVLKAHARLDVLVNNAGLSIRIPHTDLKAATPALWRQMLDVNLIAPFMLVAEAETALRQSASSGRSTANGPPESSARFKQRWVTLLDGGTQREPPTRRPAGLRQGARRQDRADP